MRCKNEKCLFNFHHVCSKCHDNILLIDKNGKCTCFEKVPKMTTEEFRKEVIELARHNSNIKVIEF